MTFLPPKKPKPKLFNIYEMSVGTRRIFMYTNEQQHLADSGTDMKSQEFEDHLFA
jgi:hypothetical protein